MTFETPLIYVQRICNGTNLRQIILFFSIVTLSRHVSCTSHASKVESQLCHNCVTIASQSSHNTTKMSHDGVILWHNIVTYHFFILALHLFILILVVLDFRNIWKFHLNSTELTYSKSILNWKRVKKQILLSSENSSKFSWSWQGWCEIKKLPN